MLLDKLEVLANPPEKQIAYLCSIGLDGDDVDELALEFEDAMVATKSEFNSGNISTKQYEQLLGLNSLLDDLSNNSELWNEESLRVSNEWETVRSLAKSCLLVLKEE